MADVEFTPDPSQQRTKQNPLGFLSGFLYKSFFFAVLVFLLPLFPSQAPEFVNQTILSRSWELIHLLLVGIAVSYGLFSRRNADQTAEKELLQKPETSQSYMSQVLQVASVFDDDDLETPSMVNGSKTQMWNSRYYRGESTVVVAPENSGDRNEVSKPLFLPVRSLKSKVSDPEPVNADQGIDELPEPRVRSGDLGLPNVVVAEEEESVVRPSPIPWRSRSGRMDVNAESGVDTAPFRVPVPSPAAGVVRSRSFQSRRTRRVSPSPSTSPSSELRAKNGEDSVKKRSTHKPSPPPAPPPPPPPPPHFVAHKSQHGSDHNTLTKRSFKDELKDVSRSGGGRESMPTTKAMNTEVTFPVQKSFRPPVAPPVLKTHAEKKNGSSRKFIIESSSSSSSSSSDSDSTDGEEEASNSGVKQETDANEVDKKADEFIAKFREQIRLQRIESIKRSTVQKRTIKGPKE